MFTYVQMGLADAELYTVTMSDYLLCNSEVHCMMLWHVNTVMQ